MDEEHERHVFAAVRSAGPSTLRMPRGACGSRAESLVELCHAHGVTLELVSCRPGAADVRTSGVTPGVSAEGSLHARRPDTLMAPPRSPGFHDRTRRAPAQQAR